MRPGGHEARHETGSGSEGGAMMRSAGEAAWRPWGEARRASGSIGGAMMHGLADDGLAGAERGGDAGAP